MCITPLLPCGSHTKSYWKWPFTSLIYPLKMVIFHSYGSLAEGIFHVVHIILHCDSPSAWSTCCDHHCRPQTVSPIETIKRSTLHPVVPLYPINMDIHSVYNIIVYMFIYVCVAIHRERERLINKKCKYPSCNTIVAHKKRPKRKMPKYNWQLFNQKTQVSRVNKSSQSGLFLLLNRCIANRKSSSIW